MNKKMKSRTSEEVKKTTKKSDDVSTRITRVQTQTQTDPVERKSKEDASEDLVKLVLSASTTATANIKKSGKGRCVIVEFSGLSGCSSCTAFVFGGASMTIVAETDPTTNVFNMCKRAYDSVENAAKFIRCAFIKDKIKIAVAVPVKVSRPWGSKQQQD